jgi:cysteine synthase A
VEQVENLLSRIGNTPLVRLHEVVKGLDAEIYVKPEYLNPSGSIKDRIALYMIKGAEKAGKLKPGVSIVEASTGNTATAFAYVATTLHYRMFVFAPKSSCTPERLRIIQSYGAHVEIIDTEALKKEEGTKNSGIHGAIVEFIPRQKCLEMELSNPNVWWARQFSNPDNVRAHREGTGKEILEQTDGKVDAFVASIGTGGSLLGVSQALHSYDPKISIYGVEPGETPHLRNGIDAIPKIPEVAGGILLDILHANILNEVLVVSNEDAIDMAHQLSEKEGLFCGMSSGANVLAAIQVAKKLGKGARVVTLLPDSRDRYLTVEQYTT